MDWTSLPREHAACVLCGADAPVPLSTRKGWPVSRCPCCGLIYLSERPSEAAVTEMYGRSYYEDGDVGYKGYRELFDRFRPVFGRIFDARAAELEALVSGRRLLEIGCAYGFLLDHLGSRGWEVTGVEVSPLSSAAARDRLGLDVRTGTLDTADLPPSSFDVILMLDVLEHLHRPYDALRRAAALLAPGGRIVIQCPWELTHWEEVFEAVLRGRRTATIEPDAIPAHLYFFGPATLDAVIESSGLVITGRRSGNYGEIRRRASPPAIVTGSPAETAFRWLYYRAGVQRMLYGLARRAGLGNGLTRYAAGRSPA